MNELKLNVNRKEFEALKSGKTDEYALPEDILEHLEVPVDFDSIRFIYGSRSVARDFEGLTDGIIYVGDKSNARCSGE